MTAEEFVRLMREHKVTIDLKANGQWDAIVAVLTLDSEYQFYLLAETANDPLEAMEKLAEKIGWK